MKIKIKWNKLQFDDVEVDPANGLISFKEALYRLTGLALYTN